MPMWLRYAQVASLSMIWKWFYYAPNTMKELFARRAREAEKRGEESYQPYTTGEMPSAVSTTSSSEAKNIHDMTFRAAAPQGFAPQPAVTQPLVAQPVAPQPVAPQPVAPQPVGVQPLAAPTTGTPPAPAVTGQVQTSLTAAQTRRFSAQVEAASAKADLSKALQASKAAHRAEAAALAHVSAPGLDAAQKQAATAELALARSKHAEAASVVQAAKARAAKAYEEVILSEEAEGATVPQLADATKARAATVYEGAIAQAGQVAHHGATGVQTALRRGEP